MACECIAVMNKAAAEHNTRLCETFMFRRDSEPTLLVVTLMTEKINTRDRKKVTLLPTFCPFCGVRYREEAKEAEAA